MRASPILQNGLKNTRGIVVNLFIISPSPKTKKEKKLQQTSEELVCEGHWEIYQSKLQTPQVIKYYQSYINVSLCEGHWEIYQSMLQRFDISVSLSFFFLPSIDAKNDNSILLVTKSNNVLRTFKQTELSHWPLWTKILG